MYICMVVDGVLTIQWSASSEWVLVTGGCDGAIRLWDIRRAGCFQVLDQSNSQLGRRPSLSERHSAIKVFSSQLYNKYGSSSRFWVNVSCSWVPST